MVDCRLINYARCLGSKSKAYMDKFKLQQRLEGFTYAQVNTQLTTPGHSYVYPKV